MVTKYMALPSSMLERNSSEHSLTCELGRYTSSRYISSWECDA